MVFHNILRNIYVRFSTQNDMEQNYFETFPSVDNWKAATCFFRVYNFVYKVGDFPEK